VLVLCAAFLYLSHAHAVFILRHFVTVPVAEVKDNDADDGTKRVLKFKGKGAHEPHPLSVIPCTAEVKTGRPADTGVVPEC